MKKYVIVKVTSHGGTIPNGLMIVVEHDKVSQAGSSDNSVCFENPIEGGFSFGEVLANFSLELS